MTYCKEFHFVANATGHCVNCGKLCYPSDNIVEALNEWKNIDPDKRTVRIGYQGSYAMGVKNSNYFWEVDLVNYRKKRRVISIKHHGTLKEAIAKALAKWNRPRKEVAK